MIMTKDLILRYFHNKCSKSEIIEVEHWLANLKDDGSDDLLLKEILNSIQLGENEIQAREAFKKFEHTVTEHQRERFGKKQKITRKIGLWYRYAAAILLFPLIVACFYFYTETNNPKEWVEEYVPYGQNKMIYLPDSTKLWLNAGTKLIYPKQFNHSIRQVYVAGEVYAEVQKDKNRPFVVSAGEVSVQVLGTKFNLKSYSEDSQIVVSLLEGAIQMNTNYNGSIKSRILKPGEVVKFEKSTGRINSSEFIPAIRKQWYQGQSFYFIDETLEEIAISLERYFDVRINIENEALKTEVYYSVFINNESLEEILSALNINGKMTISRKANTIYIK